MESRYYLAKPGGKSFNAAKEWQKMHAEACEKVWAFCEKINAGKKIMAYWERIHAFYFDHDPGREWRHVRYHGDDAYYPSKSSKRGKELIKEIESLGKFPDNGTFSRLIGAPDMIVSGNYWARAGFESFGDTIVISVPQGTVVDSEDEDKKQFIPPDAVPLKMSEYYKLKESAEDKKQNKETAAA